MWNEQVAWWKREFKYPANFKYMEPAVAKQGAVSERARGAHANARPEPGGRDERRAVEAALDADAVATGMPSNRPHAPVAGTAASARPTPLADALPEVRLQLDTSGTTRYGVPTPGGIVGGVPVSIAGRAMDEDEKRLQDKAGEAGAPTASIALKPWDPQTPYLGALKSAGTSAYTAFLSQRDKYGASPAFYLDCADFFLRQGDHELAIRILTDISEMQLESPQLLRVLAHRLEQIGELDLAIDVFEKVLKMRPEEPQSHRDLALVLADQADWKLHSHAKDEALQEYHRAEGLLGEVVMGEWDSRFPEIETIALSELNDLHRKVKVVDGKSASPVDSSLESALDYDMRVVLTWDTDETDMDLWVTEPSGEKCFYNHTRTTIGGAISKDFTQGYGPEVYTIRKAMPGMYKVQANYFGTHQQTLSGPTTLQVTLITSYGRPNEKRQSITLRLVQNKEVIDVGDVTLGR